MQRQFRTHSLKNAILIIIKITISLYRQSKTWHAEGPDCGLLLFEELLMQTFVMGKRSQKGKLNEIKS